MTVPAAIAACLRMLADALDDPGVDITQSVELLMSDVERAIPSFIGLSVVVQQADQPLVLTVISDAARTEGIRSSLHVALPGADLTHKTPPPHLILYSRAPGCFIDLAADLAWLLRRPLTSIALDQHLTPATTSQIAAQLGTGSDINQAIGLLIGRGHSRDGARKILQSLATYHRIDQHAAARRLLDGAGRDTPPP